MTSFKVADSNEESLASGTLDKAALYRTAMASNGRQAFQALLNDAQASPGANGLDVLKGLNEAMATPPRAGAPSSLQATALAAVSQGGLDGVAAVALLKAASLVSQSSNLQSYSIQGAGRSLSLKAARRSHFSGDPNSLGSISAMFESGQAGSEAIGYDENGGTSYGTYQISSRQGTMTGFLDYLSTRAPDMASQLKSAGPANTGGRTGGMPSAWQEIAARDPEKFSRLQHDFIEESHYLPALQDTFDRTGVDIGKRSKALQETLWSTAVQHGPYKAGKIFSKAIGRAEAEGVGDSDASIIDNVYAVRSGDFGSSSQNTRSAVRGRFREERDIILSMLQSNSRRV